MGILNVTPDSFSDGGLFRARAAAVEQALKMRDEGADIIDIGGESTRPGAADVALDDELERVIPVLEAIRRRSAVPISIDTSKAAVMRAAVAAGANMINDVTALGGAGALDTAAQLGVPVCLMHMRGTPRTMQEDPVYADVVEEVTDFLLARVQVCREAGMDPDGLIVDPGFGFGKSVAHNLQLLARLEVLVATGVPVLAGLSRKSMLQSVTGRAVHERIFGSVALATLAAFKGARIIRAHDVAATADAVKVAHATRAATNNKGS